MLEGNEFELENLKKKKFVLVYLSKQECSVCHVMKPKLKEISMNYEKAEFIEIDLDETPSAVGVFSVFSMPALLVYSEGKELSREARFFNLNELTAKLNRYYNMVFE